MDQQELQRRQRVVPRFRANNRRTRVFLAGALLVAVAAGCTLVPVQDFGGDHPWRATSAVLTTDGTDGYVFSTTPDRMAVTALDGNSSGNLRTVFYPTDVPPQTDSQSCATWTDHPEYPVQQGASLRISTDWAGTTRAITVTKNVLYGFTWVFNVHLWISGPTPTMDLIAQFNVARGLVGPDGHLKPFPWRLCARAIGSTLDFKVWPTTESQPAWGNPDYGGTTTLPDGWTYPGHTGWYGGHLAPGQQINFTDLATYRYGYASGQASSTTAPDTTTPTTTPSTTTTAPTTEATSTTTTSPQPAP